MIKKREDIELMAPVGSYESLMAAIQGGADSVYFGIEQLNMRARSSFNFSRQDLAQITEITKKHGIKTYLTLNTVIFDHELNSVKEIIDLALLHNIHAIIAADQSVIDYSLRSGMELHLSTQLNISNLDSLRFYARYADVVVLARELNLEQVAKICTGIESEGIKGPSGNLLRIEMFIHGALCMAISGKCYLSLHVHNHSANRGDCFQVCRRGYIVKDRESGNEIEVDNEHIMSPKDLMTIHFLNKIIDSGVTVLKIEGRARSPEYVKTVSSCYHEAICSIAEGTYTSKKIEDWKNRLAQVFNRGFWDGYYLGQKLGEWSDTYGSNATIKKVYTGKAMNYFNKIGVAEFLVETGDLHVNDEILITGPTTGVFQIKVKEIRVNLKATEVARKGDRCSIPIDSIIRRSDKLYKLISMV